jgi:hypothetical protein
LEVQDLCRSANGTKTGFRDQKKNLLAWRLRQQESNLRLGD